MRPPGDPPIPWGVGTLGPTSESGDLAELLVEDADRDRAEEVAGDRAVGADEEGGRGALHAVGRPPSCRRGRGGRARWRGPTRPPSAHLGVLPVQDTDDAHAGEAALHLGQERQLVDALLAPGAEEVDHHRPAPEPGQRGPAVDGAELEGRRRPVAGSGSTRSTGADGPADQQADRHRGDDEHGGRRSGRSAPGCGSGWRGRRRAGQKRCWTTASTAMAAKSSPR